MATQPTKLQVIPRDTGNLVKDAPASAARRATASREARVLDDLTSTRQYVNALAPKAASYMGDLLDAEFVSLPADQLKVTVARDILDRTIGKAPTELRVGPSAQATDIIKELSEHDARTRPVASDAQEASQ